MNMNIKPSNRGVLMGVIDPDAYAPATYTTGWVSASDFHNFLALISWGTLGTTCTINAKLQQATDSSGTSAKDVSGYAITAVDSTDSPVPHDKQAIINMMSQALDVANGFDYVRLSVTLASTDSPQQTSDAAAYLFGFDGRYNPEADATTVAEVV